MVKAIVINAIVTVVFVCAGCTPRTESKSDSAPAGWPKGLADFTFVWSAENGVDLTTGPAVAVRAYLESFQLVELTGDERYLYPGFSHAVPDGLRPNRSGAAPTWVGTQQNRILSLTRSGRDVTAIGCMYTYGAASPHGQGKYESQAVPPGAPTAGITEFKVTLTAPSEQTGDGPTQVGPSRTPFNDVFDGYQVTGYWGGYFRAEADDIADWTDSERASNECVAQAPDKLEKRKYLTGNFPPRGDFPTLPPAPGWPAKPAS